MQERGRFFLPVYTLTVAFCGARHGSIFAPEIETLYIGVEQYIASNGEEIRKRTEQNPFAVGHYSNRKRHKSGLFRQLFWAIIKKHLRHLRTQADGVQKGDIL